LLIYTSEAGPRAWPTALYRLLVCAGLSRAIACRWVGMEFYLFHNCRWCGWDESFVWWWRW
jgi:hypothetical protein